jgi:hypothetical protein
MVSVDVGRQQSGPGAFPIGQRVTLPGHFPEPVVLEAVRPIGAGYECRVHLRQFARAVAVFHHQQELVGTISAHRTDQSFWSRALSNPQQSMHGYSVRHVE